MPVARDVSRAIVEDEIGHLDGWVRIHNWGVNWDPSALRLVVEMRSKIDNERYAFEFLLEDYRALPPVIELVDPRNGERGMRRCFPAGGRGYFHPNLIICAPWSRKAYAVHGGPHSDWVMSNWATYRPNHAQLGDMLVLLQELLDDRSSYAGRMAP